VSPSEEPEAVLEMLRRQGLDDTVAQSDEQYRATPLLADGAGGYSPGTHRGSGDAMAMSIDESGAAPRDAKTRREVRAQDATRSEPM
jgi:hypothetical protein